jgi:hypothetical protein
MHLGTVETNLKKAGATITTEILQRVGGPDVFNAIEVDHVDLDRHPWKVRHQLDDLR